MSSRKRVFVPVSTTEYARLYGVSERTARRRLSASDTTYKQGTRLYTLVPASEYARRSGQSASSVRKRKGSVRTTSPVDAAMGMNQKTLREKAVYNFAWLLSTDARRVGVATVEKRMLHANRKQMTRLAEATDLEFIDEYLDTFWRGDDDESVLFYHG